MAALKGVVGNEFSNHAAAFAVHKVFFMPRTLACLSIAIAASMSSSANLLASHVCVYPRMVLLPAGDACGQLQRDLQDCLNQVGDLLASSMLT
jgi:hypothetical protein